MLENVTEDVVRTWRKSSYSGTGSNNCVEAAAIAGRAAVRDSKLTDGPVGLYSAKAWAALIDVIKH